MKRTLDDLFTDTTPLPLIIDRRDPANVRAYAPADEPEGNALRGALWGLVFQIIGACVLGAIIGITFGMLTWGLPW
jgi:hypothetical protein